MVVDVPALSVIVMVLPTAILAASETVIVQVACVSGIVLLTTTHNSSSSASVGIVQTLSTNP